MPKQPTVLRTRDGMALPIVLLLIAVVSVLAAGAMTLVGSERRVVGFEGAETQAYAIARTGMERFLANRGALGFVTEPPAPVESVRVNVATGYADVVLEQLRAENGISSPALYVLRSRGVRLDRSAIPRPLAERTIAQYARFQRPAMQMLAGWTSLRGIAKSGNAGLISGVDACGGSSAVAGVAVPTAPGYVESAPAAGPVGSPNILDLGSPSQTAASVLIDWGAISEHGIASATYHFPGNAWPTATQFGDPTFWPVMIATGNFVLPTDGRGLLAVTGDLSFPASRRWDGVLLVGGMLRAAAGATINGAMVTGLSLKFGLPNIASDSVAGSFVTQFNSCAVAQALAGFGGLSPLRNATIDKWAF